METQFQHESQAHSEGQTSAGTTEAAQTPLQIEAEDVDTLAAILRRTLIPLAKRQRRGSGVWLLYLMGMIVLVASLYWDLLPASSLLPFGLVLACTGLATALGYLVRLNHDKTRLTAAWDAIRRLSALDDVRAVGPLLDAQGALMDVHGPVGAQGEIYEALARLLPRLSDRDRSLLSDKQLHRLHWYAGILAWLVQRGDSSLSRPGLSMVMGDSTIALPKIVFSVSGISGRYIDFGIDVVKALAHVGNTTSIACLERIAKQETTSSDLARLRDAARVSLLALRERLEREQTEKTLLRPAADPDPQTGKLLRPARSGSPTAPEQLLRPTDGE